MQYYPLPSIKEYWKENIFGGSNIFSMLISNYSFFNNIRTKTTLKEHGKEFIKSLCDNFKNSWDCSSEVAIDEWLAKFKGEFEYKQYS